ncbi:MAG TPA: NIPSNAP family protein [Jatrophihabitans sp.]|nr:NIPSNAP family protein [Jatrophihabitans sp.]
MADNDCVLEIRLFTVKPGSREEFHRISEEGTIPLMRKHDIDVVAFGPSLNNEDGYYLIRAFDSEEHRITHSQVIYNVPEWAEFDEPVSGMIVDYHTTVVPTSRQAVAQLQNA